MKKLNKTINISKGLSLEQYSFMALSLSAKNKAHLDKISYMTSMTVTSQQV